MITVYCIVFTICLFLLMFHFLVKNLFFSSNEFLEAYDLRGITPCVTKFYGRKDVIIMIFSFILFFSFTGLFTYLQPIKEQLVYNCLTSFILTYFVVKFRNCKKQNYGRQ